jgi:hypothetical protein
VGTPFVQFLCLDERQHPKFQVQMHVRRRVPLLKIVCLNTMLSKFRVAKPQLILAQVVHFVAPIAVRRSAANYELFHAASKVLIVGEPAPVHAERLVRPGIVNHGLLYPVAVAIVLIAVEKLGILAGETGR